MILILYVSPGQTTESRPGYLAICAGPVEGLEKQVIEKLGVLLLHSKSILEIQFDGTAEIKNHTAYQSTGTLLLNRLQNRSDIRVTSIDQFMTEIQSCRTRTYDAWLMTGAEMHINDRFNTEQYVALVKRYRKYLAGGGRVIILSSGPAALGKFEPSVSFVTFLLGLATADEGEIGAEISLTRFITIDHEAESEQAFAVSSPYSVLTGLYEANQVQKMPSLHFRLLTSLPDSMFFWIRNGCAIGIQHVTGMLDCMGNHGLMIVSGSKPVGNDPRELSQFNFSILGDGDRYNTRKKRPKIAGTKVLLPMQQNSGFRPYYENDMNTTESLKRLIHGLFARQAPFAKGGFVVNEKEYEIELRRNTDTAFFASPNDSDQSRVTINLDCTIRVK
jgi:hypothetical protein